MKQTFTYKIMLAAFALFSVAGCSNDEMDNQPKQPDDTAESSGVEVQFTAGLGAETRTSHESDGQAQEGFIVKWKGYNDNQSNYDKVGICLGNPDDYNNPVNGAKNIPYRPTTSGTSSPLEADGTPLSGLEVGKTYNFYSYYPYDNNQFSNLSGVNIPNLKEQTQEAPNDNKHIGRYDFIYAKQEGVTIEAGNNPPTVNFQYAHPFTSLQFNLKNGRNAAVKINKITLERQDGSEMKIPITYNLKAGAGGTNSLLAFQHLTVTSPTDLSAGATQKFWMMLYPKSIGDATELKLSVHLTDGNGVSHIYTLKKAVPTGGFEAGYNYTLEMNVKDTDLSPDTESWTTLIATKAELEAFRDDVNNGNTYNGKIVRLTNHINLSGGTWAPIGNSMRKFTGTFDGGGYHISSLNVNTSERYAGLFGNVDEGIVRNLRVSGTVTGSGSGMYVGGIAGLIQNSIVENCIFSGTVNSTGNVGGIAGYSGVNSRIAGCHTEVIFTTTNAIIGGIVGGSKDSSIDGCYSEAEVTTNNSSGGIVGNNINSTVTHCYATGKVSGKSNVGGIIGYRNGDNGGTVTGCIALNPSLTREGNTTDFGRIVGKNYSGTITNCAAFTMALPDGITATNDANGKDGASLTKGQCLTTTTYTSRGFTTDKGWKFDSNTPWQYLPWNKAFESFPGINATDYKISVPDHLKP